ncbi:MAG: hypothetical protein C4524_08190 [Candidatus Zixiibacteriota bacterium]|nr:MAG: hypothetical protein C4524_08190 [candidate division Zixibacteria bacterium]
MKRKFSPLRRPIAGGLLFLGLLALTGCEGERGPQGPAGVLPVSVNGSLNNSYVFYPGGLPVGYQVLQLELSGMPTLPELYVNGVAYPVTLDLTTGNFRLLEYLPATPGDMVRLEVNFPAEDGRSCCAWTDLILPDSFALVFPGPDTAAALPLGADLEAAWEASAGADAYRLVVNSYCYYLDAQGQDILFSYLLDTLISDTAITLPGSVIGPEPAGVDSILSSTIGVQVRALHGPWQSGDPGNVHGDGVGLIQAWTYGGYGGRYFVP